MNHINLNNLSVSADNETPGNVVLKFGTGPTSGTFSIHWKAANSLIPMVYAACRFAQEKEVAEKNRPQWSDT